MGEVQANDGTTRTAIQHKVGWSNVEETYSKLEPNLAQFGCIRNGLDCNSGVIR